jgi:ubiquinone/menaquinone biosynthesis C-methylase UbiE
MSHISRIRQEFEKQAGAFNDPRHTIGSHDIMAWIVDTIRPSLHEVAVDVAAGTALLGRALARHVKRVTAIDATPAMLEEGKKAAREEALTNIEFLHALAESIPFPAESFDLTVSRLAVHHFPKPKDAVTEMCRITAADGRVFIVDLVSPDDPALLERYNDLERMRDPSHVQALRSEQLLQLLRDAGETPVLRDIRAVDVDFQRWVQLTKTPEHAVEDIQSQLLADLDGGEPTGFQPRLVEGSLKFRQRWAIIQA